MLQGEGGRWGCSSCLEGVETFTLDPTRALQRGVRGCPCFEVEIAFFAIDQTQPTLYGLVHNRSTRLLFSPPTPCRRNQRIFYLPCGDLCSSTCLAQDEEQPTIVVSMMRLFVHFVLRLETRVVCYSLAVDPADYIPRNNRTLLSTLRRRWG